MRLSVASGLVGSAALAVAGGLAATSYAALAGAAVLAVVAGAAAIRILHTELIAERRSHQRQRAAAARDAAARERRRDAETAKLREEVAAQLAVRETVVGDLELALDEARGRLDVAEERGCELLVRLAEVEIELDVARAEADALGAELAAWQAAPQRASA